MLAFIWPLFLFVPGWPATGRRGFAAREGLGPAHVPPHPHTIARFLLAKMIYMDGLNTLFIFGGIYAAGPSAWIDEVLFFGIL